MPTQITINQLLLVGFIAGFVCGLVPLILGLKNQNRKSVNIGILGFILTLIGGTFFSLLGALPIAGVFSWLILRKPAEKIEPVQVVVNENPIDVSVKESENS